VVRYGGGTRGQQNKSQVEAGQTSVLKGMQDEREQGAKNPSSLYPLAPQGHRITSRMCGGLRKKQRETLLFHLRRWVTDSQTTGGGGYKKEGKGGIQPAAETKMQDRGREKPKNCVSDLLGLLLRAKRQGKSGREASRVA